MITLRTVDGQSVKVTENEIIWNALDFMRYPTVTEEDGFILLSLYPRRPDVLVYISDIRRAIDIIAPKFA